jgi:hypothetical protein
VVISIETPVADINIIELLEVSGLDRVVAVPTVFFISLELWVTGVPNMRSIPLATRGW